MIGSTKPMLAFLSSMSTPVCCGGLKSGDVCQSKGLMGGGVVVMA